MVKCPRCNSKELYRFGKDPKTKKQKYQCQRCKRQFKIGDGYGKERIKYPWMPKCPKCNHRMEIYKWRKYFKRLRCKRCNHKFNLYSIPEEVLDYLSRISFGKANFQRMRYPKEVILRAIRLCYEFGLSSRDISKNFYFELGIKVSNVTVYQWSRKFACLFSQYTDKVSLKLSKTWHIDETVIKINGKKHWIYVVLCHKSRFVIAWYLSKTRSIEAAVKVLRLAIEKAGFKPNRLISDRHPLYKELTNIKPRLAKKHIFVEKFSVKLSNNLIERFFGTLKTRFKRTRGFKSFYSTCCFLTIYFVYYNYFRPHISLRLKTPAEVAGFKPILPDRWFSVFFILS
jgi:transposase-like protein/DNA-directed RNA polymerase subunit RPC12/RpoP